MSDYEKSIVNAKNFISKSSKFVQMSENEISEKKKLCIKLRKQKLMLKHISLIVDMPISTIHAWLKESYKTEEKVPQPMAYRIIKDISLDKFKSIVKSSVSVRESLLKMKMCATGSAYSTFYKRVKENNICILHFKGRAHGKNNKNKIRTRLLESVLVYGKIEIASSSYRW